MADKIIRDATLTVIANAIRSKAGTSGSMVFPQGFISTLDSIPTEATGYKIATGMLSYPTKTQGFATLYFDFNLQGAILMLQDISSTSRSDCVSTLSSWTTSNIYKNTGMSSYSNTLSSSNGFIINGKSLSWSTSTSAKYFYGEYFYMVWGL